MLEEFGILPNYTLLDDMVTLDVSVTWIDPETQEYKYEPASYRPLVGERAARVRPRRDLLREGLEILIDAVDLGPETRRSGRWRSARTAGSRST